MQAERATIRLPSYPDLGRHLPAVNRLYSGIGAMKSGKFDLTVNMRVRKRYFLYKVILNTSYRLVQQTVQIVVRFAYTI